ncbi:hypothetical protein SAMD00019534_126000 [Acytostelium subglobosum LB1]|uniref:hypothetical protein n=1 Tax=Acytostelium subglobosum LB1 TaxID=1410327 RepID=UPI000644B3A2|nr:hypothetical protein SAMD00019534_126000 [Acytostelium subglobosum LB1]GAM29424.1 hypothetical protein SAMD00019534_126000 [Acytostelium subglobosum LB1]|eukprot:XP_012747629.1 hypothetical protein SAMD00019534_126000 [Acytostelium subglobosum LB1]
MVQLGGSKDSCTACNKTVYMTEKIVVEDKEEKKTFHKLCLKCSHCKITLSLGNYASMNGVMFCKPHFKQLFATKGNYDEGFGQSKHTTQWAPQATPSSSQAGSFIKLEESNKPPSEKKETPSAISSRFAGSSEKCAICSKTVFLTEKIVVEEKEDKKVLHKGCLKCTHCNVTLNLSTYSSMNGVFYCKPHVKQLFAAKGNFGEAFGNAPQTDKWTPQAVTAPASFVPVDRTTEKEKPVVSTSDTAKKFSAAKNTDKCQLCQKTVYLTERVVLEETDSRRIFHKVCMKCSHCSVVLNLGTLAQLDGVLYCKPHFKQLFALKGNLDEGFGRVKRTDNPFPYLEKKDDYVSSADRLQSEHDAGHVESEMEKFKRLSEMKYVEDDVKPVFNPSATYKHEEEETHDHKDDDVVEKEQEGHVETEMEKYKRLSEMKYVDDDVKPVFNPNAVYRHDDDEKMVDDEEVIQHKEVEHHHHHEEEKEREVQHPEDEHLDNSNDNDSDSD